MIWTLNFDNIFPANEISETNAAAKFDGKAGRRLFDHVIDVLVKVEFINLTYMIEEHIPLNNPDHYPIYVINQFPDISGSRWLLKTLLSRLGSKTVLEKLVFRDPFFIEFTICNILSRSSQPYEFSNHTKVTVVSN